MDTHGIDAIIASDYETTARMVGRYFKDNMWMTVGVHEFKALAGSDRRGEFVRVETWHFVDGLRELGGILKARGMGAGRIGLQMTDMPACGLAILKELLPLAVFVDASQVLHQEISRKSRQEISHISKSVEASEAGFRNTLAHMRECLGKPVSSLVWRYYAPEVNRHDADLLGSNLTSEAWSWREDAGEPLVAEGGEPINFDVICAYQGLLSDIAFRAVVGKPDREFAERFHDSVVALEALANTIRAGMKASEAQGECLDSMRRSGSWWDGYWAVHGAGFHVHELPMVGSKYLGMYGDYLFEKGQVLSIETIAEQSFVLTEDGLRRLGEMPMKIYTA